MTPSEFQQWRKENIAMQNVIGIDPDLVKSGVAEVKKGQIIDLQALAFFDLINLIDDRADDAVFVLEDVEHSKSVYIRPGTSPAQMRKIAQNVGQVKAIGRLLKQYLEGSGARFVMVKPLRGTAKKAKKDASYFNKITGWTGISNEDKRDAGMLALSITGAR